LIGEGVTEAEKKEKQNCRKEKTQTMYAHVSKRIKKRENECIYVRDLCVYNHSRK
jgi:hypothetical protein